MIDLRFDSVSKRYKIREEDPSAPVTQNWWQKLRQRKTTNREFAALSDVSFEVRRGEALGIVGHNGAGKSTILKLLSNITTPTTGEITINGKIAALLEVGSGFHPELTGRENTYLSGSILGMRRSEITEKLDRIIDFAGVRQFIDIPVKRYSSGMYVRLGFSIAAHLEPDILLLDEVLAVGDAGFQTKCKRRIQELRDAGMTIIFISHDLSAVRNLCNRALLLERGRIIDDGTPDDIIRRYTSQTGLQSSPANSVTANRKVELLSVMFFDGDRRRTVEFASGEPLYVRVDYRVHEEVPQGALNVYFYSADGAMQTQLSTGAQQEEFTFTPGLGRVEFFCPEICFQPDVYHVDFTVERWGDKEREEIAWHRQSASIFVEKGKGVRGRFFMPHTWRLLETSEPEPAQLALVESGDSSRA